MFHDPMDHHVDAYRAQQRLTLLKADGWSFVELAHQFGLTRRSLSRIAAGVVTQCTYETFVRITDTYLPPYPQEEQAEDTLGEQDDEPKAGMCQRLGCSHKNTGNELGLCKKHYEMFLAGAFDHSSYKVRSHRRHAGKVSTVKRATRCAGKSTLGVSARRSVSGVGVQLELFACPAYQKAS